MKINLAYYCQDCGDGSVNIKFYKTLSEAEKQEEESFKINGYSWGDPSASEITLEIDQNTGEILNKTYRDGQLKLW